MHTRERAEMQVIPAKELLQAMANAIETNFYGESFKVLSFTVQWASIFLLFFIGYSKVPTLKFQIKLLWLPTAAVRAKTISNVFATQVKWENKGME